MKIQESGENYLEMVLILKNETGYVRSVDIARAMSFSKPSVSRAMSILKKTGHIIIDEEGRIELTETGLQTAERIYNRHRLLTEWLIAIGVSESTAAADACRIEHIISQETFDVIREHTKRN
jgi:Mn-dependent DtxR family transcriptional regulator